MDAGYKMVFGGEDRNVKEYMKPLRSMTNFAGQALVKAKGVKRY